MRRVEDIMVIVYNRADLDNGIVKKFLSHKSADFICYEDEEGFGEILHELKERGLSSKEVLILKPFKGRIFQKCPGSPGMICCNYYLLNTCFDCLYNCAYCFLNSYLNAFGITQFINLDGMVDEMLHNLPMDDDHVYRVGTGEFTDSLMFDEVTGIAASVIAKTAHMKNVMMEFKTKSNNIDHLLGIAEKGNTVLAWTLNTDINIEGYEEDTASLDERLEAAQKAAEAGYFLAFHFDPVIMYDNYLDDYCAIVDRLFSLVDGSRVAWISLGGYRHSPGFKEIVEEKFPSERLSLAEMFPGEDGKFRYLKSERINIYRTMKNRILSHSKVPFVYLCMESISVWNAVFGVDYRVSEDLEKDFVEHLKRHVLKE